MLQYHSMGSILAAIKVCLAEQSQCLRPADTWGTSSPPCSHMPYVS